MTGGNGDKAASGLPKGLDVGLRIAAVTGLVALAVVTIACNDFLTTDEAGFVVGAILLALLLAAVPLRTFSNLRSVKAFGVEIELAEKALEKAETIGFKEEGAERDVAKVDEIVGLQLLLEAKLAYVAKHILARDASGRRSSFLTVGSLEYDKLLSRKDAIAARELLALTAGDIERSSESQRAKYRNKAKPLVGGIRATIFYKLVEQLVEKTAGEAPRQLKRRGGKRADLWLDVEVNGQSTKVLVFPALAIPGAFWYAAKELADRARDLAASSDVALIVVPPAWVASLAPQVDGVEVIPVGRLMACEDRGTSFAELLVRLFPQLRQAGGRSS